MLLISAGGIITGAMSDFLNARAISSVIMMYLAVPTVSLTSVHSITNVMLCKHTNQEYIYVCSLQELLLCSVILYLIVQFLFV